MFKCPRCHLDLEREYRKEGFIHRCSTCGGEAVSAYVLEHAVGSELVRSLRELGVRRRRRSRCRCPECERRMLEIPLTAGEEKFEIDYCLDCRMYWFDAGERSALPTDRAGEVPSRSADGLAAREAVALARVDRLRESLDHGEPAEGWKQVLGFLGFPVEYTHHVEIRPLATWSVAAACALLSICAFILNPGLTERLAYVPADPFRLGGVGLLTGFLMHGDWMHLLGNMYFLCVFGDNVEERLCWKRFLALLFAGHVVGAVVHGLFDPDPSVPCVGASAGISAVLVCYALQFPRERIGFMWWVYWRPHWFSIAAGWALAFWFAEQVFTATLQLSGLSSISALAHLGGAFAGAVFWCWRERPEMFRWLFSSINRAAAPAGAIEDRR